MEITATSNDNAAMDSTTPDANRQERELSNHEGASPVPMAKAGSTDAIASTDAGGGDELTAEQRASDAEARAYTADATRRLALDDAETRMRVADQRASYAESDAKAKA